MYLCQVKPVDRDVKWTVEVWFKCSTLQRVIISNHDGAQANEFASHLVKGKELQGKIVMRWRRLQPSLPTTITADCQ